MNQLVSICIPTYNRESYIIDAVRCSLNQTYKNIEVIVSDNKSQDGTVEMLKEIKDSRLKIYVQKDNIGMVRNWNFCLDKARGKYIKILASDDTIFPNCIEKQVDFLEKHPTTTLVSCKRQFINKSNKLIKEEGLLNKTGTINGLVHAKNTLKDLRVNGIGEPSAVLIRQSNKAKKIKFDKNFFQMVDLEYWIRLSILGDVGYINESLCQFRVHKKSTSGISQQTGDFIKETMRLINKYYDNKKLSKIYSLTANDKKTVTIRRTQDFISTVNKTFQNKKFFMAGKYALKILTSVPFSIVLKSIVTSHGK